MKKIVLFFGFAAIATVGQAQSIDDVRGSLGKKEIDYAKSKDLVDKHLANPKNAVKSDGWYYKGFIYNAVSKRDSLKGLCADCKAEAFEAFKKYQELDKKNTLMVLEQNASLFDLYNGFFDAGAAAYNDKDFKSAFTNFKNALLVEDYVRSKDFDYNGYKYPSFDTVLVLNTALAARLDKNDDEAMKYYKMLADVNVSDAQYLDMYQYMAQQYGSKKDVINFNAALATGRKLYPEDPFWTALEIEIATEGLTSKDEIFAKYDELVQKNPTSYEIAFLYSSDLYKYFSDPKSALDKAKKDVYKEKFITAVKKAIAIKSTGEANLQMGVYLYNNSYDYIDEAKSIKGEKPADISKRKALYALSNAGLNDCIPYCEAAAKFYAGLPKLKSIDKANYANALRMLQNVYEVKKNTAKVAEYEKLLTDLN